jgi:hypothetical protein
MHLAFTAQTTAYHTLTEKQAFFSSLLVKLTANRQPWRGSGGGKRGFIRRFSDGSEMGKLLIAYRRPRTAAS